MTPTARTVGALRGQDARLADQLAAEGDLDVLLYTFAGQILANSRH